MPERPRDTELRGLFLPLGACTLVGGRKAPPRTADSSCNRRRPCAMRRDVNVAPGTSSRGAPMRNNPHQLGDLDGEEFRAAGHRVVDWIAADLARIENYPVPP